MKTKICNNCNLELDLSHYKKYSKKTNGDWYHETCRECEELVLKNENWKDGLLKCHICGEYFYEEAFQIHNSYSYRNNRDKRCKKCKNSQNKEARTNYSEDQLLKFLIKKRYLESVKRAKEKEIENSISEEYILELYNLQKGKCAISNIDMTYNIDSGRTYTNLSIDRKDSKLGYTKSNIQLVCMSVNQLKSDLDMETVVYLCKEIINNYTNGKEKLNTESSK